MTPWFRILGWSSALGAAASVACASPAAPNVLYFGNSFTKDYYPLDVPGVVSAITDAAGLARGTSVRRADSSYDLQAHLDNTGANSVAYLATQTLPAGQTWDFVVIQGLSTEATTPLGDPATFRANARTLFEQIRVSNPSAKAVLFETWARNANAGGFYPAPFDDPADMQEQISTNYGAVVETLNAADGADTARYAGVGDAFARRAWADDLYGDDHYHANDRGGLLAGLTIWGSMYGPTTRVLAERGALDGLAQSMFTTHADIVSLARDADAAGAPAGDADLDRDVDFDDLLALAQHYGQTAGQSWFNGDFDANGGVDFADLLALAQQYGKGPTVSGDGHLTGAVAADWALARSLVPEPAVAGMIAGALVALRRRAR